MGSIELCLLAFNHLHPLQYPIKVAYRRQLRVNYDNFPGMGCMTFFTISFKQWALGYVPRSIIIYACEHTPPLLRKVNPFLTQAQTQEK